MSPRGHGRVLALFPSTHGFGFALFDEKERLVDWGVTGIRQSEKNRPTLKAIEKLIERFEPATIVTEDTRPKDSRRRPRIRALLEQISALARARHLAVHRFSRASVRHYFGIRTKRELSVMLASAYPAVSTRLPPKRQPWMSEDVRQSLFDAVALGVVCLAALDEAHHQHSIIPA